MKMHTDLKIRYILITLLIMCNTTCNEQVDSKLKSSISVACWSSRGMLTSIQYLNTLMENNDIVSISEHWLYANCLYKLSDISDKFNCVCRSSKHAGAEQYGTHRGQSGVALFWRKELGCVSSITDINHERICGIRLQTKSKRIINFFSIYLPSQGSPDDFGTAIDECGEIINSREPNF